jgi:hypothetical protein
MIRKTFLIIAIITLGALSGLGNTPNSAETGAETTSAPAEPAALLQNCGLTSIRVDQPRLVFSQQRPHSFQVRWAVLQIQPGFVIKSFRVSVTLRNSKLEGIQLVTSGVNGNAREAAVLIPVNNIERFFSGNSGTRFEVQIQPQLASGPQSGSCNYFFTGALVNIAPPITTPPPTSPPASPSNIKLDITDIKINGSRSKPVTMQVSWTITKPASAFLKGAYGLRMDLSGNGVTGKVVQTPTSSITSVAVGLLGIPADIRAKLFDPKFTLTATVTLNARIISDGKETFVEVKESKTFPAVN